MNFDLVKINQLEKSPQNARRTGGKAAADDLKASIAAHGLMHNLVVTQGDDGSYRVTDGARRLAALKALQKEGKLPADYAVPCQVRGKSDALETSLAANTVRLSMHPADEYEAFAKLAAGGSTPEQIAGRFGQTSRYVEQRLKLGNADPALLKEFREERLSLDCLMAFALTDDRKRQLKVWRALKESHSLHPRAIRAALTESMADADSKLAKFVGVDAYREAGGTTQSDLFSERVYLENPQLLNELAAAKLEANRKELEAEGWGWITISHDRDWEAVWKMGHLPKLPGKNDSDQLAAYHPEHLKFGGCYVSIEHDGELRIERGLARKQDLKRLEQPGEPKAARVKTMPESLRRELAASRQQIAQAELARHRLIALDWLIFTAASDAFAAYATDTGLDVTFGEQRPKVGAETLAGQSLAATEAALPLSWLKPKREADRFRAFSGLSDNQKLDLLAWSVATSLKPRLSTGEENSVFELALSLTAANVAAYWRPTAANYLGRITRDQLLSLGRELLGEQWASSRARDKKGELAAQLERAFAEPEKYGRTPEQRQKLAGWLPEGMASVTATPPKARKKPARKVA